MNDSGHVRAPGPPAPPPPGGGGGGGGGAPPPPPRGADDRRRARRGRRLHRPVGGSVPAVVPLPEVDRVEIVTVLDLSLDLLMAGSETVRRATMVGTLGEGRTTLRAEHGFSSLVTVVKGGRKEAFLFDAGLTKDGLLHNMDVLEVRPAGLHPIVLSHGP